jgi:hypothetical protein
MSGTRGDTNRHAPRRYWPILMSWIDCTRQATTLSSEKQPTRPHNNGLEARGASGSGVPSFIAAHRYMAPITAALGSRPDCSPISIRSSYYTRGHVSDLTHACPPGGIQRNRDGIAPARVVYYGTVVLCHLHLLGPVYILCPSI